MNIYLIVSFLFFLGGIALIASRRYSNQGYILFGLSFIINGMHALTQPGPGNVIALLFFCGGFVIGCALTRLQISKAPSK
jgi:hypothetical protein